MGGEVEQRRRPDAHVDHVGPGAAQPLGERGEQAIAGEATVAADGDAQRGRSAPDLLAERGDERAPERAGHLVREVGVGDAADVVLAEGMAGDLHGGSAARGAAAVLSDTAESVVKRKTAG